MSSWRILMNVSYICCFELESHHVHTLRLVYRSRKSLSLWFFLIIQWLTKQVCVLESPVVWLLLFPKQSLQPLLLCPLLRPVAWCWIWGLMRFRLDSSLFAFEAGSWSLTPYFMIERNCLFFRHDNGVMVMVYVLQIYVGKSVDEMISGFLHTNEGWGEVKGGIRKTQVALSSLLKLGDGYMEGSVYSSVWFLYVFESFHNLKF